MITQTIPPAVDALIEAIPGVCDGSPVIAGTRIPVYEVVELTRAGLSPESLLARFGGNLKKDHILAALAYAWQHRDEIEAEMKESAAVQPSKIG